MTCAGGGRQIVTTMRLLTRHLIAELTKAFIAALTIVTLLLLLVGVAREALGQSLPPTSILRLIPFVLPDALRIAVPVTLLLATTSVFGRLAGQNEMLAVKSLGISPMVFIGPALVLAFLVSLTTVWLNDLAVSWGREGVQRVVVEAAEEIAYNVLRHARRYRAGRLAINVKRVEGRRLIMPTVTIRPDHSKPGITITAQQAELSCDAARGVLKIVLYKGSVDIDGQLGMQFPEFYEQEIPLGDANDKAKNDCPPSWLPLRAIPSQLAAERAEMDQLERSLASQAACQLVAGDFVRLASKEWDARDNMLRRRQEMLCRLRTEPHRRWSAGFSCFFFVLVGAPMALRLRNCDFLTSFFLCFLPVLVVYYPLLAYGVDVAKSGTLPPAAVWTGNLLLALWGGYLLRRVHRY